MRCESKNPHRCSLRLPTTRAILVLRGLNNRLLVRDYSCWIAWIKDVMRVLDMKAVANIITMLWNSWNNRNNYVFRGKEDKARVIWDRAKTLCQDLRDSDGFVLEGGGGFKDELMSTKWAKLYAFEESLRIACSLNISKAIFETDCAN
ncbi:hypothetical protein Gogos_002102 [Gossypium gossypioides]|uniref:RNase H type-1 domain-containing protein n=1 Tax=Gossypium gossypioides TaxID=34282 RepID=A0A7J9CQN3_GOSGO|nr:hypothetical protein [Gossypium gossypioides]